MFGWNYKLAFLFKTKNTLLRRYHYCVHGRNFGSTWKVHDIVEQKSSTALFSHASYVFQDMAIWSFNLSFGWSTTGVQTEVS